MINSTSSLEVFDKVLEYDQIQYYPNRIITELKLFISSFLIYFHNNQIKINSQNCNNITLFFM